MRLGLSLSLGTSLSSGGGPAPEPWSPADLATPATHWFDADDATTLTLNNARVTTWGNKGSAGGSVAHSNNDNRPTLVPAVLNSKPIVRNTNGTWFTTLLSVGAAFRLYAVLNLSAAQLTHSILGGVNTLVPLAQSGSSATDVSRVNNANVIAPQAVFVNSEGVAVSNRGAMFTALTGGSRVFSMRNVAAFTGFTLFFPPAAGYVPTGDFAEILFVPEASIDQDIEDRIQGYLHWKWGLQALLPSAHPYKSAAPTTGALAALAEPFAAGFTLVRGGTTPAAPQVEAAPAGVLVDA